MRIGIMQPYFMPYIGYILILNYVDKFIILDDVQFMRHGWIERNRILKPNEGWQYFNVPLKKHHQKDLIRDIQINNDIDWKNKIISQLVHYKNAPHYKDVIALINSIFEYEYTTITELNIKSLKAVCNYLDIKTEIELFSDMGIEIDAVKSADEWALNICKAIDKNSEYINPPGGSEFFDREKYKSAGINLSFLKPKLMEYNQKRKIFEPGLSIIDVMMFNSKEEIRNMLNEYEFI